MDIQTRIRRLRYRSWHRGCKETDIILGNFADAKLDKLSSVELDIYEQLLEEDDSDIWSWVNGNTTPENSKYLPFINIFKSTGALQAK